MINNKKKMKSLKLFPTITKIQYYLLLAIQIKLANQICQLIQDCSLLQILNSSKEDASIMMIISVQLKLNLATSEICK